MKTIAFVNQKGGVGKTTTVINVGMGLQKLNKKVLLIDLDPQGNLTYSMGIPAHELKVTIFDLLKEKATLSEVIIKKDNLDIVTANLSLSGADMELAGIAGREFLLKDVLDKVSGYDYVLIDCPPNLGILTLNALTAANAVFVPLQTEYLAMQGMSQLLQTVEVVKTRLNKELKLEGIIGTMYDSRRNLCKEVVEKLKEHFGDLVFDTLIRDNVALAEAPSFGKSIFDYRKESNGAKDYFNLCKEIVKRGE